MRIFSPLPCSEHGRAAQVADSDLHGGIARGGKGGGDGVGLKSNDGGQQQQRRRRQENNPL